VESSLLECATWAGGRAYPWFSIKTSTAGIGVVAGGQVIMGAPATLDPSAWHFIVFSEQIDATTATESPNVADQITSRLGGGTVRVAGYLGETGTVTVAAGQPGDRPPGLSPSVT
jgi:hypothetical protein